VEYIQFTTEYQNQNSSQFSNGVDSSVGRLRSTSNLNRAANANTGGTIGAWQEFVSASLPTLKIGDNVVWLGDVDPVSGIVKWTGRTGRNSSLPLMAWVEMVTS